MRRFIEATRIVALAAIVLLGLASGPALSQSTNAQLLSLISADLPSGSAVPISNFRTVLNAMVNSTNVQGTSCPTSALTEGQPWTNTTSAPAGVTLNVFDGANCVPWALLNTTAHTLTILGSANLSPGQNIVGRFGSMDVWQRGAGASASISVAASTTAYTVDGCYLATGTGQASTVSASTSTAPASNRSATAFRNSGQTGTAQITFGCPLDSDEIALARTNYVTLSFWSAAGANFSSVSGSFTANLMCGTGSPAKQVSGYAGQTTVATTSQSLTLGGGWTRFQVTSAAVVPSNCTQMEVQWTWSPTGTAGANDWIGFDSVQLEVVSGPQAVASPFQSIDFGTQLRMAQRHYTKTFPYGTAPAQNAGVAGALSMLDSVVATVSTYADWRFPMQMRANPSVTSFNPSATNANCRDATGAADRTVTVDPDTTLSADHVPFTCAAGGSAGNRVYLHATADAGI